MNHRLCPWLVLVAVALRFAAVAVHGQTVLLSYDFEAGNLGPTFTAGNVSAGSVGTGPGISFYGVGPVVTPHFPGSTSEPVWHMDRNLGPASRTDAANATDWAGALAADDYATFSLTVNSGYTVALSSLGFAGGFKTFANHEAGFALYSSVTGFSGTPLGSVTAATSPSESTKWTSVSVDLSSIGSLQALGAGTYEFRFYFADNYSYAGFTGFLAVDNIEVSGTVSAIPEPTAGAALAGTLMLALAGWRRRISGRRTMRPPNF